MATNQSVTPESIAAERKYQAEQRQAVFESTGLRIVDAPPYRIHCPRPGCTFVGSATTDGGAVRSLAAHLVGAHMRRSK